MNKYFIYQHRYNTVKNSKEQNCVDWTELRLKKHLQLPYTARRIISHRKPNSVSLSVAYAMVIFR